MPRLLTDEEKLARGTLDERTSEAARGKREIGKILKFPVLREIPEPKFVLTPVGRKTFDFWAKKLMEAGLLTESSIGYIENLALADDSITAAIAKGKSPAYTLLETRRKNLQWLETLNVDTSVAAGQTQKGTFASHGFANRLQLPADHRARRSGA
jgi:hypothetical protein